MIDAKEEQIQLYARQIKTPASAILLGCSAQIQNEWRPLSAAVEINDGGDGLPARKPDPAQVESSWIPYPEWNFRNDRAGTYSDSLILSQKAKQDSHLFPL